MSAGEWTFWREIPCFMYYFLYYHIHLRIWMCSWDTCLLRLRDSFINISVGIERWSQEPPFTGSLAPINHLNSSLEMKWISKLRKKAHGSIHLEVKCFMRMFILKGELKKKRQYGKRHLDSRGIYVTKGQEPPVTLSSRACIEGPAVFKVK